MVFEKHVSVSSKDGTSWENGGRPKQRKKMGETGMKKRKKKYSLIFFFFGIGGDHGHHRSPPNPSLVSSEIKMKTNNFMV
jgi:hypothetical protein